MKDVIIYNYKGASSDIKRDDGDVSSGTCDEIIGKGRQVRDSVNRL